MISKCNLCDKNFIKYHINQKFCGDYRKKNTCAEKSFHLSRIIGGMKDRSGVHPNYRHVKISKEWVKSSLSFKRWAIKNGWKDGLCIDRKDNSKGYSQNNCRVVTIAENNSNKTNAITSIEKRTRKCRLCKKVKNFDMFCNDKNRFGRIAYECKLCRKLLYSRRKCAEQGIVIPEPNEVMG